MFDLSEKSNVFQIALLVFFAILFLVGVFIIATIRADNNSAQRNTGLMVWGPRLGERGAINSVIDNLNDRYEIFSSVTYVEKNPLTMYTEFLEAVSQGRSPDLLIVQPESILQIKDKLFAIPYERYPAHEFRSDFVEGAEIFALSDGILALPFVVDPLVLYTNRDIFTNSAIATIPTTWDEVVKLAPELTKFSGETTLVQSAIAFGEYDNILHAHEIVGAMLLQSGASIVSQNTRGRYLSDIAETDDTHHPELAIQFYTDFANPHKTVYSWNKTFDRSREAFAADQVAMYAGFMSEYAILPKINPNLNYGMHMWPQSSTGRTQLTYGKFYGIAVSRFGQNPQQAYNVAAAMTSKDYTTHFANASGLPTTRRDSLTLAPSNPFSDTILRSALAARAWIGARNSVTDIAFSQLINDVVNGTDQPFEALETARSSIDASLVHY